MSTRETDHVQSPAFNNDEAGALISNLTLSDIASEFTKYFAEAWLVNPFSYRIKGFFASHAFYALNRGSEFFIDKVMNSESSWVKGSKKCAEVYLNIWGKVSEYVLSYKISLENKGQFACKVLSHIFYKLLGVKDKSDFPKLLVEMVLIKIISLTGMILLLGMSLHAAIQVFLISLFIYSLLYVILTFVHGLIREYDSSKESLLKEVWNFLQPWIPDIGSFLSKLFTGNK